MKWTDIEIRRHVIPTLNKEEKSSSAEDDDEEELPPLEQPSPEAIEMEKKTRQLEALVERNTQSSSPDESNPKE